MKLSPIPGIIVLVSCQLVSARETAEELRDELLTARSEYEDAKLAAVQERLLAECDREPKRYLIQLCVAESFLLRADLLRNDRKIRTLDSATNKEYRGKQVEWGEAGLPYAEAALRLARRPGEKAQAERVIGELYVHQISGPFSGLVNGPRALSHVRNALGLAPDDPECNRAIGLMYLYNPPINGGDVDLAIKTFRQCTRTDPESDVYQIYLSQAFRKKGSLIRAELAARKALRINPKNVDARHLVAEIRKQKKQKESED